MEEGLPLLQEILFEFYLNDAELAALLVGSLGLEEVEFSCGRRHDFHDAAEGVLVLCRSLELDSDLTCPVFRNGTPISAIS